MSTKKTTKTIEENTLDNIEETPVVSEPVAKKKTKREIKDTDRVVISNNRNWNLDFVSSDINGRDITIPASVKHWKQLTVAEVE